MKRIVSALVLAFGLGGLGALGCSDDTFVATNEQLKDSGAQSGGSSGSGGAGKGGATGSGGEAGSAGSAGSAGGGGASGSAGAAGSGGSGACTPGQKQDVGTCEKCGTSRRTCDANGAWGSPVCEGQGECNPGEKAGGCGDVCEEKVCGANCSFGGCAKKSGAACTYQNGTNWQCCGNDMWQFCNKDTCNWHPCAGCGSSCASQCN